LISITSRVDLAMSVRANAAKLSETIKAKKLGLSIQILGVPTQPEIVISMCRAHYNARKRP